LAGLRIIAGTHRGRPLRAPTGLDTRPTSGRVREALFSILGDVSELDVLDLYAGSGALGIEALSRGARHAVFVESRRPALACLRQNLSDFGLEDRALVLPIRVEQAKAQLVARRFDLVFCDPPWARLSDAVDELDGWIAGECLTPEGRLVLEHPEKETPGSIAGLSAQDRRSWGDTGISLYWR
jgi:16S rRNA (guanine966-N2)-methyltransferase